MKKLLLLLTPFLFVACFTTNKIHTIHDDFKNEKKVYIKHRKSLQSIERYDAYIPSLAVINWQIKDHNDTIKKELLLEIDLDPTATVSPDFYIRTSDKTIPLKFKSINSKQTAKSYFEEDKQQKNDSLTIITKTEHNEIKTHFKAKSVLKKDLVNAIIQSESLLLRIYIDDTGYNINYTKTELASIKKVLLNL